MEPTADYVRIFDTTLRDGEQSPGATMTSTEKLEVARALARLGVDVIEAGFPAASPDDLAAVRNIAAQVGAATDGADHLRARARAPRATSTARGRRCKPARARASTRSSRRELHLEHKLRMTRGEVLARVAAMVAHARALCDDVEFSPEDAGRSDPDFLYEVLAARSGRRDDGQHSRHRRLHDARGVRRAHRGHPRERPGARR